MEQPIRLLIIVVVAWLASWVVTRDASRRGVRSIPWIILAIGLGLLAVERMTISLREEIATALNLIARDIESNDFDRIVRHVSRQSPHLRHDVSRYVPKYMFDRVTVKNNLRVERESPESDIVVARFNAVFLVSESQGQVRNLLSPWFFIVRLAKEDGEWKVVAYERRDPREGL